jgi:class 3 adenylate cyclase
MFLVLWFGVKHFFQSTRKNAPTDFKGKWKYGWQSHPEIFFLMQKELGCLDKNGNPVDLNHSQILNLLFKPFLDLAYKHKLTRIGPNGDSLILFGPVEQEERNKCTIMLKAALDARELYEMHLEEFKHQHQLHPDSHSKVTLQFGRALGFGEINVNLIGGSYTGQLDYHTETINLLARVEKFTKKMNTDFLITQDFLNELNQETAQSGAALHDIVIRYLGSYDFDASAQKVKLYQAGYAHKLRELFSPSRDFDQAILNMDQKFYEKSLEFLHNHLALYPQDVTALAIQALCKTHLSLN